MAKFLVDIGANIHADNDYALRWACERGHSKVAKFLVEKGANIHVNPKTYRFLIKHEKHKIIKN